MIIKFVLLTICLIFSVKTIRVAFKEIYNAIEEIEDDKTKMFWFWCIITILLWTSYIVLI